MATFLCSNQSSFRDIMINGKKELPYLTITNSSIIFYLELIPCKAEQPLHDMELQEKKVQKD